MHIATYICIKTVDGTIWQLQRHAVVRYGGPMGYYATMCRLPLVQMGLYVMRASPQASYASMRSIMHQPLSDLSTHLRECVHKIDT